MAGYGIADNIFTALIDEQGVIWEAGTGRKRQAVGIDSQKEQDYQTQITEMQGIIDNYYGKLVDLGVIVPPKSAEEIAQEQARQQTDINQKLLEAINNLQAELGELKNVNSRCGNEPGIDTVGQAGESAGQVPTGSKKRNGERKTNPPGDTQQSDT